MGNRTRWSTPTMRRLASFSPIPSTCMAPFTTARHLSSVRSGPRHVAVRRSRSPASAIRARQALARGLSHQPGSRCQFHYSSMTISARRPLATRHSALSDCGHCSTCSTAISVTPTWPKTGCAPGGISGRTTPAVRAIAHGCPRPVITRMSWATDRSATRPIRPISRCRRRQVRLM